MRVVLDVPHEWTVFLDPAKGEIYRMSGFDSGDDFNALVGRFDHEIEDQAASAGRQVELMAILGVAAALDDDVGMGLEQADQLVCRGHLLALQDPMFAS